MQDDPSVQKRFADSGLEVLKESPEEFRAHIRRDYDKFRDIIRTVGLQAE